MAMKSIKQIGVKQCVG